MALKRILSPIVLIVCLLTPSLVMEGCVEASYRGDGISIDDDDDGASGGYQQRDEEAYEYEDEAAEYEVERKASRPYDDDGEIEFSDDENVKPSRKAAKK